MKYRIIYKNWKYKIQYRKRFWFWTDLPVMTEDFDFGFGVATTSEFYEFESYQGALRYLRQHLGREAIIKEARFI